MFVEFSLASYDKNDDDDNKTHKNIICNLYAY